ncbi:hypothetical protein DSL72_002009 [Monilinia vaccinii-corymbosi]|uniref:BZIP domain-containing protein n=1 Tax=Monilinia vaccinii-corymbosi TaxID=61207 RepID=A0A8A3PBE5_9HELO|nr:hypothetical protein DSL72_002009 [Monilinia vaccinii-corymbosi]
MNDSYYPPAAQSFFPLPPATATHPNASNIDESSNSPPHDAFDQFQTYDYANQYHAHIPIAITPPPKHKPSMPHPMCTEMPTDMNEDATQRGSNSDDENNMTPAQSRRKAQNRAAQRAFRERKDRHVKDLEAKLAAHEKNSGNLALENKRLKLQLTQVATENEILKAISSGHAGRGDAELRESVVGPMRYTPTDFYHEVLDAHENRVPSHRVVTSENGERLLAAGATWDYITNHPLYKQGLVDVGIVSEKLKRVAKCDGQGPVFEERAILDAIEQSVANESDELL